MKKILSGLIVLFWISINFSSASSIDETNGFVKNQLDSIILSCIEDQIEIKEWFDTASSYYNSFVYPYPREHFDSRHKDGFEYIVIPTYPTYLNMDNLPLDLEMDTIPEPLKKISYLTMKGFRGKYIDNTNQMLSNSKPFMTINFDIYFDEETLYVSLVYLPIGFPGFTKETEHQMGYKRPHLITENAHYESREYKYNAENGKWEKFFKPGKKNKLPQNASNILEDGLIESLNIFIAGFKSAQMHNDGKKVLISLDGIPFSRRRRHNCIVNYLIFLKDFEYSIEKASSVFDKGYYLNRISDRLDYDVDDFPTESILKNRDNETISTVILPQVKLVGNKLIFTISARLVTGDDIASAIDYAPLALGRYVYELDLKIGKWSLADQFFEWYGQ